MQQRLNLLDWSIIIGFFILTIIIGLVASKKRARVILIFPVWPQHALVAAGLFDGRHNLLCRYTQPGNGYRPQEWCFRQLAVVEAFLLTGMLTVFVAKLWRRSSVQTDLEFYELRYGLAKPLHFLHRFERIYLGVFFNIIIMATVSLAAIKIGGVMLGLTPIQTILIASIVTVTYSSLGGLTGIIWTDFFQFIIAMVGIVGAAYVVVNLPQVGGVAAMLEHPNVIGKLNVIPDFSDMDALVPFFILPLAVQWWSVCNAGRAGGGGYIAQRMLSPNRRTTLSGQRCFSILPIMRCDMALVLVALASLIVFPDLASLKTAFPHLSDQVINDDLAYPTMMTFLPHGLLGLVLASLIAAFMSTISTQLNWGSSYDQRFFYKKICKTKLVKRSWSMLAVSPRYH
ncbi:MAG: hypothetical protein R2825_20720 [Saprospiraceae bacterium]